MTLSGDDKKEIIKNMSGDEMQSGRPESQIGIFTKRIEYMTEHLKLNRKDHSARRGLIQLVSKRKRLLTYLKKNNLDAYKNIMKELKIRESKG
ncbi:MAG: 30S ribosomal protein S15 [Candidatus Marinimicrobia bacterium]|nr:30S ribosomal protein S15 [Candidatus Neomarinimicrobiota bacterium]